MHPHSSRLLSVLALVVTIAGCSGSRDESIRSLRCTTDDECPSGQLCREELCKEEDTIITEDPDASVEMDASDPAPVLDAAPDAVMTMPDGMVAVRAAGRTQGANATVEVVVVGGDCQPGACTAALGATVTFRAPQVAGYRFVNWSGDAGCTGESAELVLTNVSANIECVANYAWRLSVRGEVMGGAGEVAAASSAFAATCEGARCEVDQGQPVTLKAPVQAGFRFQGWAGMGCPEGNGDSIEVKPVEGDVVCTAKFVPGFVIRGKTEGSSGAVVDVKSEAAYAQCKDSACQVDAGSRVTLSAPDVTGFRFAGFGGDAPCLTTEHEVVIASADADLECVAIYVARHQVSGSATGPTPAPALQASSLDTYATCSGSACTVDHAGSARLFAPTVSGYRLRGWSGAGCMTDAGAAQNVSNVTQDVACVAEYVLGVGVSGAAAGGANPTITASSSSPGAQCSGASCGIDMGGSVTLTTTQVAGFTFSGWTGDAGCTSSELSVTLSNVLDSRTCTANYTRLRYRVAGVAAPAEGGSIQFEPASATASCDANGCTVDYGSSVKLTARKNASHDFVSWEGCANNSAQPSIDVTNVTAQTTCTARFRLRTLSVTVSAVPAGSGSITTPCNGAGSCTATVNYNADQPLAAQAGPNYVFREWTGCVATTAASTVLQKVTADQVCSANFGHSVSAVVQPAGQGSVPNCFGTPCSVAHNASLRLLTPTIANPAQYEFTGWSGCGGATQTDNSLQLSAIGANLVCTANLALRKFRVTVNVSPAGAGTLSMPCNSTSSCFADITYGNPAALTVTPMPGYVFTGWTGCSPANAGAPSTQLASVTSAQTCTATFNHRVTTSVAPAGVASAPQCAAGCAVNHGGSITLNPPTVTDANYEFQNWNCGSVSSGSATFPINPVNTNLDCVANYARPTYKLDMAVAPANAGSVTGSCNTNTSCAGSVLKGETPAISATSALRNVRFVNWTGCAVDDPNAASTKLKPAAGDQTCTANFVTLYGLSVVSSPAGIGTFSAPCAGASCSETYTAGSTPTITVNTAPTNYVFRRWSGCSVANANAASTTLSPMMSGQTCTAEFEHRVTAQTNPAGVGTFSACSPNAPCYVKDGGSITIPAPPTNGNYAFAGWSCPGGVPQNDGTVIINPVTTHVDCVANYRQFTRSVTVRIDQPVGAAALGTVTPACNANAPCNGIPSGSEFTLTATPLNTNVVFVGWSECVKTPTTENPLKLIVSSNLTCVATFRPRGSDLVTESVTATDVRRVTITDPATGGQLPRLQMRVTVVIANRGDVTANLDFTTSGGPKVPVFYGPNGFVTAYEVAGESDIFYPRLKMPIAVNQTVTITGLIRIPIPTDKTVQISSEADSRAGDEFVPAWGRVQERDETNNRSSPITVAVP